MHLQFSKQRTGNQTQLKFMTWKTMKMHVHLYGERCFMNYGQLVQISSLFKKATPWHKFTIFNNINFEYFYIKSWVLSNDLSLVSNLTKIIMLPFVTLGKKRRCVSKTFCEVFRRITFFYLIRHCYNFPQFSTILYNWYL